MKTSRQTYCFWGIDLKQKLYVRSFGDFILVPPDTEMFRTVDFGEIFWPVSGRAKFVLSGKEYILKPGHVWYYPPGSWHEYYPIEPFRYCFFSVAGANAAMFFNLLGLTPGLNPAGECPVHQFAHLENDLQRHTAEHRVGALNTAFAIASQLTLGRRIRQKPEKAMTEARNCIDSFCSNPNFSVKQLASELHMHRGSLSRSFSKTFGTTISEYITHTRLQTAMTILQKTDYPISRVAENCGFHSSNYFSKVFLAHVGLTPQNYRRSFREKE